MKDGKSGERGEGENASEHTRLLKKNGKISVTIIKLE
jgi:hypothetical protein